MPVQLLVVAVLATPVLWGEEFGWRGYLQIRLRADRPLLAAVATGLIWGACHYPLVIFAGYNFPDDRLAGLLVFLVSAVLLSIIFGRLMLRTGSVWAPSLAHAATNVLGSSLVVLLFFGGAQLDLAQLGGRSGLGATRDALPVDRGHGTPQGTRTAVRLVREGRLTSEKPVWQIWVSENLL